MYIKKIYIIKIHSEEKKEMIIMLTKVKLLKKMKHRKKRKII